MNENAAPKEETVVTPDVDIKADTLGTKALDRPAPRKVLPIKHAIERYLAAIRAIGLTALNRPGYRGGQLV